MGEKDIKESFEDDRKEEVEPMQSADHHGEMAKDLPAAKTTACTLEENEFDLRTEIWKMAR